MQYKTGSLTLLICPGVDGLRPEAVRRDEEMAEARLGRPLLHTLQIVATAERNRSGSLGAEIGVLPHMEPDGRGFRTQELAAHPGRSPVSTRVTRTEGTLALQNAFFGIPTRRIVNRMYLEYNKL
jgi:hypothetical protein